MRNCDYCRQGTAPARRYRKPWQIFGPFAWICPTCKVELDALTEFYAGRPAVLPRRFRSLTMDTDEELAVVALPHGRQRRGESDAAWSQRRNGEIAAAAQQAGVVAADWYADPIGNDHSGNVILRIARRRERSNQR